MTLLAFFLGLAIGLGFWLWRQALIERQLRLILKSLQTDAAEIISLPIVSRLRRGVASAKAQQSQLERKLETWQQLLQQAPIGYLHIDEENQLLWCNQQARQLLQINRWEPGQDRLLLKLVRSYELDQLIEQTRQRQQPSQLEWVFYPTISDAQALSQVQTLTLRASSIPLPEGEVAVFLENRQPLVEISQARDRTFSDLAHELRTPLTSIRLVAETLQGRLEPPLSGWVDRMVQEVNRLINLVQDLLELSRLERDPSKYLSVKPVELRELIESVWQTLEPFARQKQLNMVYFQAEPIMLNGDRSRLTQVFLNLLDNSIKYSPHQNNILVEVELLTGEDAANRVEINIIDSGSGFAEADLPHVFERLYRGEPSRHRAFETSRSATASPISSGSGVGLAIVRQIIQAHGGSVEAKNHLETGGAWVQIKLPTG